MTAEDIRSGSFPFPEGPGLMVHGGAWDIPLPETEAHEAGMRAALQAGRLVLEAGGPALEAVVAAVSSMESSGTFDAGRGSVLTREGHVEVDAGLMRSEDLAFGAVAAVRRLANPIAAARRLMDAGRGEVRLMTGDAVLSFLGLEAVPESDLIHPREYARWEELREKHRKHSSDSFVAAADAGRPADTPAAPRGTVGCVARDGHGNLAAGTSTGGTPFRPAGRVGDSPLPGAGYYADRNAAASATGWGEAITAAGLSGRVVEAVAQGADPQTALRDALGRMGSRIATPDGVPAAGGLILITVGGGGAWAYSTPRMARAGWSPGTGFWTRLEPRRPVPAR